MWKNIDEKLVIDEETKREAFFFILQKQHSTLFFENVFTIFSNSVLLKNNM